MVLGPGSRQGLRRGLKGWTEPSEPKGGRFLVPGAPAPVPIGSLAARRGLPGRPDNLGLGRFEGHSRLSVEVS